MNPRTRRQRKLLRRADKAAKRLVSDVAQSVVGYQPLSFMYQLSDGRLVSQREHHAAITFRRR